jgi:hypothetical protein
MSVYSNRFDKLVMAEDRQAITLEDVFTFMAAFGGVHMTAFDSLINGIAATGATGTGVNWTVQDGTWGYTEEGYLAASSAGAGDFGVIWCDESIPSNFVVEVCGHGQGVAIAIRGTATAYYVVYISDLYGVQFYKVVNGVGTLLNAGFSGAHSENITYGYGRVRVAAREMFLSSYDQDKWLFLSAWQDDTFLGSHAINLQTESPGFQLGLCAPEGDLTCVYGTVRVPDLTDIIPFATLDPGEVPWGGIERAVADKVVKAFVRYNGTLKAWRPKPVARSHDFTSSGLRNLSIETDIRDSFSRLRLYYSLSWVEVFDETLYEKYGHRFFETTSQVIETEDEALTEAQAMIRRAKEYMRRCMLDTFACGPFLEPEDRVLMPDGQEYLVETTTIRLVGNRMNTSIEGRHYVFAE